MGKITNFLRELVYPFSLILTILGIILIIIGLLYYGLGSFTQTSLPFIYQLGWWNAYVLIGGLIIFAIGFFYLYSYMKRSRFVVREMKTNKRSEIQGKRAELHRTVKHLPSKYQRMLQKKEDELNIK
jgi:phosphotransferase system  glucose/maltose/N-acetylglucosamine-specific IIC component